MKYSRLIPFRAFRKRNFAFSLLDKKTLTSDDAKCFPIDELSEDLLFLICHYLDMKSVWALSETCSILADLKRSMKEDSFWKDRITSQYGSSVGLPRLEDSWKLLAHKLYRGLGNYFGFALDALDGDVLPSPMSMNLQSLSDISCGMCRRFRFGLIVESNIILAKVQRCNNGCDSLESITFEVNPQSQREGLVVPTRYHGFYYNLSVVVGIHPNGSFFLIREEVLHDSKLKSGHGIYGTIGDESLHCDDKLEIENDRIPLIMQIEHGNKFSGIATLDITPFDPFQVTSNPEPIQTHMFLYVDKSVIDSRSLFSSTLHAFESISKVENVQKMFECRLRFHDGTKENDYCLDAVMFVGIHGASYDCIILTQSYPYLWNDISTPTQKKISSKFVSRPMVKYLYSCQLFCWNLVGMGLIGVMKNKNRQCCSFSLNFNSEQSNTLAFK
jgi:hypothetical protein